MKKRALSGITKRLFVNFFNQCLDEFLKDGFEIDGKLENPQNTVNEIWDTVFRVSCLDKTNVIKNNKTYKQALVKQQQLLKRWKNTLLDTFDEIGGFRSNIIRDDGYKFSVSFAPENLPKGMYQFIGGFDIYSYDDDSPEDSKHILSFYSKNMKLNREHLENNFMCEKTSNSFWIFFIDSEDDFNRLVTTLSLFA